MVIFWDYLLPQSANSEDSFGEGIWTETMWWQTGREAKLFEDFLLCFLNRRLILEAVMLSAKRVYSKSKRMNPTTKRTHNV